MKVTSLTINITDLQDALALQQNTIISAIFSYAAEVVENGGRIIIQQEFENVAPHVVCVFSTIEEVTDWKRKLNEVQTVLKREPIG